MFGNTLIAIRTRDAEKHHISYLIFVWKDFDTELFSVSDMVVIIILKLIHLNSV